MIHWLKLLTPVLLTALLWAASSTLALGLMVRSIRSDLHLTGALVSMSGAMPIQLEGFKVGYQYALSTRNLLNLGHISNYSLLLGSRQGYLVDSFSLSYTGTRAGFSPDGFGQVFGFLARTCLDASSNTVRASATELGNLMGLALTSKRAHSLSRVYGPLSMSIANLHTDGVGISFQIILSSSAIPGAGGWDKVCAVQP